MKPNHEYRIQRLNELHYRQCYVKCEGKKKDTFPYLRYNLIEYTSSAVKIENYFIHRCD